MEESRLCPGSNPPGLRVSWEDAQAFCKWLTAQERQEGTLAAVQSYRLPLDWEWSMAAGLYERNNGSPEAKDGKLSGYPWGKVWPPPAGTGNFAGEEANDADWPPTFRVIKGYRDDFPRTSPVGYFDRTGMGLFDMGGNLWQWCQDGYAGLQGDLVLRGGSWREMQWQSSKRFHARFSDRRADIGFRVVLEGIR